LARVQCEIHELARDSPPWRERQFKIRVGEDSCDICRVFFFLIDKNNFNLRKVVGGCGNLTQSGLFPISFLLLSFRQWKLLRPRAMTLLHHKVYQDNHYQRLSLFAYRLPTTAAPTNTGRCPGTVLALCPLAVEYLRCHVPSSQHTSFCVWN
jgi:hypothetical protein